MPVELGQPGREGINHGARPLTRSAEIAAWLSPLWLDTASTSIESFAPPAGARSASTLSPYGDPGPGSSSAPPRPHRQGKGRSWSAVVAAAWPGRRRPVPGQGGLSVARCAGAPRPVVAGVCAVLMLAGRRLRVPPPPHSGGFAAPRLRPAAHPWASVARRLAASWSRVWSRVPMPPRRSPPPRWWSATSTPESRHLPVMFRGSPKTKMLAPSPGPCYTRLAVGAGTAGSRPSDVAPKFAPRRRKRARRLLTTTRTYQALPAKRERRCRLFRDSASAMP